MTLKFTLPGVTPSQNVYDRLHWSKKYQLRNDWHMTVRAICGIQQRTALRARLTLVRVSPRLIDPSNIMAGTKPLIDALVHWGFLRGDTAEDVTHVFEQRKTRKGEQPCMEIELEYETTPSGGESGQ